MGHFWLLAFSDLSHQAYGIRPEQVRLMWATAPR